MGVAEKTHDASASDLLQVLGVKLKSKPNRFPLLIKRSKSLGQIKYVE